MNDHYRLHEKLPAKLEELESSSGLARENLRDPKTGSPFEYEIVNETVYRLCAIFERNTENEPDLTGIRRHKAGRDCSDHKV